MTLDLLAIGAHPDDVELSCGGWLAAMSARGQSAGILDLSAGELATNGSVEVRAREAAAAAEVLGLAWRGNAGLPDGGLDPSDPDHTDAVVTQIRARRPTLILGPCLEDRHPDHGAASRLVERATFLAGLVRHRPELGPAHRAQRLIRYPQRQEVRPDLVVDVSAFEAIKRQAIACHASQVGPGAATLLNQPLGVEAWTVRDRYWGASIGVTHGEPYLLGAPVPMADPVSHFAAHPSPPVLVPPR